MLAAVLTALRLLNHEPPLLRNGQGLRNHEPAVAEGRAEVAELTAIEERAKYKKLLVLVFFVALVAGVLIGWLFVP